MTVTQTATTTVREPVGPAGGRIGAPRHAADSGERPHGALRQNGPAIRSLREKDGWHQPEFARQVGLSQSALSNIEREKRSARPATIHRIARALRVPVAAITREPGDPAV